jgi:Arc/MetJ-type ribon-helix-helix transcriptional regulator
VDKKRYRSFNLHKALADKVEAVIDNGKHGYVNVPDFVRESIRRYLRELGYLE